MIFYVMQTEPVFCQFASPLLLQAFIKALVSIPRVSSSSSISLVAYSLKRP
jgi:hypothetical protein